MTPPTIEHCTKADFDQILNDLTDFWGSDRTRRLHHPTLLYEFGNTAFVLREGTLVVAYLFGFLSQTEPTGYVNLIAVRSAYQGKGLGRYLYEHFTRWAKAQGCTALKAITRPDNQQSIAFHRHLGMTLLGEPNEAGLPVIRDYAGPGQDRVVFWKSIT